MPSAFRSHLTVVAFSLLAVAMLHACSSDGSNGGGRGGDAGDGGAGGMGGAGGDTSDLQLQTVDLPSDARPAHTPGSPGVTVTNEKLLTQFGSADFSLNNARYTRYYLSDQADLQPDAIVVLVPGFEGGASTFAALAEGLGRRAKAETSLVVEVWALDRRSNQLEDTVGLDLAEREQDPSLGLDFLFGEQLGLELDDTLASELGRRAIFYDTGEDLAFMAQWTTLVHSQDIDAVVEEARRTARNANVFLGGHSAGTGFTARYAATDFNFEGGDPEPGYQKVRGLVMLEGGGGSLPAEAPSEDQLDRIEARFDGGLYGAVRSQEPRCVNGEKACTVATELEDCAAFDNTSCTEPVDAYSVVAGLLSPQLLAVSEVAALEGDVAGDTGISILQADQNGIEGNNAVEKVPELSALTLLLGTEPATSVALIGLFLDDDGAAAAAASFVATSLGTIGPTTDGVRTWLNYGDTMPASVLTDNGPPPTELEGAGKWGVEVEATDLEGRMMPSFYLGQTNFSDWYYPSSGLGVVSGLGLDTTPLSAPPPEGRGRSDIDNVTQARNVDVPVIAFGGSNGLVPVPGRMLAYADSLATCSAPSCDGTTPRVVDREQPSSAFPTFGDAAGGFEVFMSEGYSHVDVVSAEDDETNNVVAPLLRFIERNLQ
jgi:pimeloyl-ACP methyl ester carboxylesterase